MLDHLAHDVIEFPWCVRDERGRERAGEREREREGGRDLADKGIEFPRWYFHVCILVWGFRFEV